MWFCFGLVGVYFASFRFQTEMDLRSNGQQVKAIVTHSSTKRSPSNQINSSNHQRDKSYSLSYKFLDSNGDEYKGTTYSGFPFKEKTGEQIAVTYLIGHPEVNEITSRVTSNLGNNFFWIIALGIFTVFIFAPSALLFRLGFPKKEVNAR